LRVTDHVILRYLERVGGFPIEELRKQIAVRFQAAADAGAASVRADGYTWVIGEDEFGPALITVLGKTEHPESHIPQVRRK
jgi:hypothetical protein